MPKMLEKTFVLTPLSSMFNRYRWKRGKPVLCKDAREWVDYFEKAENRIIVTNIGRAQVSTIFLSLDHDFSGTGTPILFETMVFGTGTDDYNQVRYATLRHALIGHEEMVKIVRKSRPRSKVTTRRFKLGGVREMP